MSELAGLFGVAGRGLILTVLAMMWTILLVRIVGLRAFSKMTAVDLTATVATGSLIAQAGTRARLDEFLQAMVAIGAVFLLQWMLAKARQASDRVEKVLRNEPMLLMEHGQFLDRAMREVRVSRANLHEKLRLAGVTDFAQVRAVVLETTGDVSVMTGSAVSDALLQGVRRIDP